LQAHSLELVGWMRRRGRLDLLLVLPDGSRALIPAAWTDLEAPVEPARAEALASLDDLLQARRLLDGLLRRAVLAGEDDRPVPSGEEAEAAAATRSGGEPGAGSGAVGAARRGAAAGRDGAAGGADRADGRGRGGSR
jgi:hypothetical protein